MSLHELELAAKKSQIRSSVSMEAVWNVLELHRRFLKRDISKNYFLSKQAALMSGAKVWN